MRTSEVDLTQAVARFLLESGGRVFSEVPILGQSADLVWIQRESVTFVEVKINATSRAIEQCRAHELVADYVCVATSNRSVSSRNIERIVGLGYGLISCEIATGACVWLVEPLRLGKYWAPIRNRVIARMTTGVEDVN